MANIILKNRDGEDVVYENVLAVQLFTDDGGTQRFSSGGGGDFIISYMNDVGTKMLFSRPIMYGDTAGDVIALGLMEAPTKVTTETEEHIFLGWAASIGGAVETAMFENVAEDLTVYAVFKTITTVASGECGESATWKLNGEGVLTISGTGKMNAYNYGSTNRPWNNFLNEIKEVMIEDGITSVGDYAFWQCSNLTSVTIPEGVTYIGMGTFQNCTKLENVQLLDGLITISFAAFGSCTSLKTIVLPDSLITLGSGAFNGCTSLKTIVIPDGVTKIETSLGSPFNGCTNLSSITIGSGVTNIGANAFNGCPLTYAKFVNPSGWWVSTNSSATSGTTLSSSNLSNTSTAATYLKTTYKTYYWTRT